MDNEHHEKEVDKSLKIIVRSSLFIFFSVIFSKLMLYIYRIIIARHFGPEVYGLFSLSFVIFYFALAISTLGLQNGLLRFVAFYRGKNEISKIRYIFKLSLKIVILSSITVSFFLYFLSDFISMNIFRDSSLSIYIKIVAFIIPFYVLAYLFLAIIMGFEKVKTHSFFSDSLENFLKVFFIVLLIFFSIGSDLVMLSYLFATLSICLVILFYSKKKLKEIFGPYNLKNNEKSEIKREFLSYSFPLLFSSMLLGILSYTDSLILGYFDGASIVGFYNAAVPIAALTTFVPLLFLRLFFPIIIREYSKNHLEIISELSKQIEKWILIITLPFFLLVLLFPGAFINLLFGKEYLVAENSLRILIIGFMFYAISLVLESLISMTGKSKIILINTLVISFLNFILGIILVPRYGMIGAALSTTFGYFVLFLLYLIQAKHYTSIVPLRRKIIGIIFSVAIPALALLFIKQFIPSNLLVIILESSFFILFYLFLIFLTRSLDKNDKMMLEAIKKKFFR